MSKRFDLPVFALKPKRHHWQMAWLRRCAPSTPPHQVNLGRLTLVLSQRGQIGSECGSGIKRD